jgi:PHD/YefM family antitoxin component YafN of YafNO toxin-antitoxin module
VNEVRKDFLRIADEGEAGDTVAVTEHGHPVLAIMPWGSYESLMETVTVLNDKAMMHSIAAGKAAIREGKTLSLDELVASLA